MGIEERRIVREQMAEQHRADLKEAKDTAWSAGMLEGRKLGIDSERKGTLTHIRELARMSYSECVELDANHVHRVPHVTSMQTYELHRAALLWLANELEKTR